MKKVTIYLICLFLSTYSFAQVTFSPEKPQAGQTVTITYNPANGPLAQSPVLEADAFLFDGTAASASKPTPITLTQDGKLWKGSVEIKTPAVGVLIAFRDSSDKVIDNNNNKGYSTFVYGANGKIAQKARIGLAYAFTTGGRSKSFGIKTDFDYTIALFDSEFADYPELKFSNISRYASLLLIAKKEGAKIKIKNDLDGILANKTELSIEDLTTANTVYKQIDENEAAEKYAAQIRAKDPKGLFVEGEKAQAIYSETDGRKILSMYSDYEKEFPKSKYLPSLVSKITIALVDVKDFEGLKSYMVKTETLITNNIQKSSVFNSVAWNMAEKDLQLTLAEEFSRKSIELLKNEVNSPARLRMHKDTYGYILEKLGKTEEAYQNFKEAIPAKIETSDATVNERYILAAMKTGHTDEVASMGEAFIKANKSSNKIREAVKIVLSKTQTPEKAEEYIASLEKVVKEKSKNELMKNILNEPAPNFTLKDLKGNTVALSDLKGKTVILDFWATWCGPCKASFPGMQMAQNKYKDNPNVKFLFVDTWERGKKEVFLPKVEEFLAQNKYDFTVPLDIESKVVADYKVDGIPTKFVIDGNGNIRFKAVGFSGKAETVVEEISIMIDAVTETK